MTKRFENKVVVITGGSDGIGLTTAKQREGWGIARIAGKPALSSWERAARIMNQEESSR